MTEILIGQTYFLRFDQKLWEAMQPYPPLGSLYAASYLRARGHEVAFFDAMLATSELEWEQALDRETPTYALLYEDNFNYLSKMCLLRMRQAAFTMIAAAKRRGCTVIVCGSDATDHAPDFLERGADFVLLGEGEETLGELLAHLKQQPGDKPLGILGLAFKDRDASSAVLNARRPDIRDLDRLPFPAWDLVDVARYRELWEARHGYYSMNMVTTRGCPYHCNWCAKPIWGQRYNSRSPENVVAELRWVKQTYRPDHIWFADDIMGLKPHWVDRFADLVEQQDGRVPFKSLHRADLLLRGNAVEALKRAGAKTVWIGAESGSQKILDAMDKGTTVEQIYAATRRMHECGIEVGFFIQFGYPGETRDDIELTLQMIRDCNPDDVGASVSYPLPGTKFYASVRDQLGAKQNWVDSGDLAMMYRGTFSTDFYRQLHTVLHKEFRMRKGLAQFGRLWRDPTSVRARHLRRLAYSAYYASTLPHARRRLDSLGASGGGSLPAVPAPAIAGSSVEGRENRT
jgi:anaerobic magnesium-protoporphyrin IX monomethyl ester cyclase